MEKILWCPQHQISADQLKDLGNIQVVELKVLNPELFSSLSNTSSDVFELNELADKLIAECQSFNKIVMPIGSPAFNFVFSIKSGTKENRNCNILFSHSVRDCQDEPQSDGSVKKIQVFKHLKFIQF